MDEARELARENERLRKELARARREVVQTRRVAATSETLSSQSKQAMLMANRELSETIERLREASHGLVEAKRMAEQANEAKSRFLATMSHEIRTPMNGVVGSLDLLMRSGLDEEQCQLVRLMHGSSTSLLALINDILDFAKVEAGKVVLERIPFSLMDCAESVIALEASIAEDKGIDLSLAVAKGLPAFFLGDPFRLRQVLVNLVSNAIKFTSGGSVEVAVEPAGGERVRFSVTDTGIGIRPDALVKIFDPFTQEDGGTTRRYGGTGLGLSICRHLVTLMGGTLEVESSPGEGSCFHFTAVLPAARPTAALPPTSSPEPSLKSFEARVLVVDDTPMNLVITSKMLAKLGCVVETAENGQEALEAIGRASFDLVLMDCSMPVLDGYQATARIRAMPGEAARLPIVALTAYAMSEDRQRCLAAGMDAYLGKPVKLVELERTLARFLARSARREAGNG